MDVKFIFRTVLATCFVSGIVHGSFCNLPAVSMCTTASVVGNANQIVYLDSSTAPTFQLTECVCELRFELSGTISLSYRPSAPTMDNSCGVQFKYDRPNASPYTFGCSEMTSGTNVQTRTFANITFTKSLDSFRSWFSCVGIQPAPGKSVTVSCYPDVNYISPESGGWTGWGSWTECTSTCSTGTIRRTRDCNGTSCDGQSTQTRECENVQNCPVNGDWSGWTDWNECSVSCGTGSKTRNRNCDNPPPSGGGDACLGDSSESEVCNLGSCTQNENQNGGWSTWIRTSDCTVTCGGGFAVWTRSCDNPIQTGSGQPCVDERGQEAMSETKQLTCNHLACPASVNGGWTPWTNYGTCSVTCGGGTQERSRECENPAPQGGGAACSGGDGQEQAESRDCGVDECPADKSVNGGWSPWTNYRACSVTCGGGTQERSRKCESPAPQGDGEACSGGDGQEQTESRGCGEDECPADNTETPVAGAAVGTSGDDTNIAAIVGGIIGTLVALLLIILLIICLVRRRRREKKPEKRPGPRSIRYDSQGGDVTVTENELYQYDGETPAHATNALFIGGIPDTPSSPGYIPHFSTDNGSQYAVIMDSTRAKDRPNERPSLETFSASKKSTDSETSLKTPETIPPFENGDVRPFVEPNHYVDSNPDLGVDNPGYFNATGGEGSSPTSKSPYDYIDHDKLKKDDAEFENAFDDASSNEFNGYPESQADESHYKRFISSDGSEVANDGYLTSPKRDNTFEFSSPNDS
ncbi:uncharacterized protein LOC128236487 isoform X7 [Mya arenaria]|uniref:uncharacterized protein LOC128236487 isoform X7 n=1 Tax=Mya arenaria TaxID=6604 RepID=UPI0022E85B76|nr:uncharacterized protein LOC128236487 isoform X7 [Mya arenaria]